MPAKQQCHGSPQAAKSKKVWQRILSEDTKKQFWVPPGFAHGFLVLSDTAELSYKCTDYFYPEDDHSLLWRDPEVHIKWPEIDGKITLSEKDRSGKMLPEAPVFELI